MPRQSFYFALEFCGRDVSEALLDDLASQVLQHVGCSPQDLPELDSALARAATSAADLRQCDVQFHLRDGALEIVVSSNDAPLFQACHPLPDRS